MAKPKQIVTPVGTAAFVHLDKPGKGWEDNPGKYEISILFPADAEFLDALQDDILDRARALASRKKVKIGNDPDVPWKDGDPKYDHEGMVIFTARTAEKDSFSIRDAANNLIPAKLIKPGDDVRLMVNPGVYKNGVNLYLNGVQLVGKNNAGGEFEAYEGGYVAGNTADDPATDDSEGDDEGDY